MSAAAVIEALRGVRFLLEDEKQLQADMALTFARASIACEREVQVTGGIIDFMAAGGVGIEVKIGGQRGAILRQVKAYMRDDRISELVIVTARPLALAPVIGGKPAFVLDLGRAWL